MADMSTPTSGSVNMEKYESIPSLTEQVKANMRAFTGWVVLSQILGLTAVVLVAVWAGHFRGGFGWTEDPVHQFNYHPLFMVIGMVFLYGDAILVYRVFRNDKKVYIKVLHATLHIFALLFAVVALKAAFDFHNNNPTGRINNLYSLHSWIGLTCVIMFALQWLLGLATFLFPGMSMNFRTFFKPLHVFFGITIFVLAIASCLSGLTEKELFANKEGYHDRNTEGIVVNILGLVLVALAIVIGYIVTNPGYARQPGDGEEHIQLVHE